jgi:hypothetical protein
MGHDHHEPDGDELVATAIQAGALKTCPFHSYVAVNQGDPNADKRAYAIATNMWKSSALLGEREDIMDGIKQAIDRFADECPARRGLTQRPPN